MNAAHPDLRLRVVGCFPVSGQEMIEVVRIQGPDWKRALEELNRQGGIRQAEILSESSRGGTIRMRVNGSCPMPKVLTQTGLVPELPFEAANGFDQWMVLSTQEEARLLIESLTSVGLKPEIVYSGRYIPARALTERQQDILDAAVREGYYDYPRRITLTGLAQKVGVAKSTLSESLMMIERELIGNLTKKNGPGG